MGMTRTLVVGLVALGAATAPVSAQSRDDSFKWYIGGQGGVLGFETPSQTRAWVPTVGAALLVHAKRTGLLVSVDEALGSDELSGFADNTAVSSAGIRDVNFNRIRKYSAILTGYPVRGKSLEPYLGIGFGLIQVINPQPGGVFPSPIAASSAKLEADDRSTDGFVSFVGGVQFHLAGRVLGFGQYQLTSSATAGHLLRGPSHGFNAGFRFSLGGAKEGIRGGGY
jgi:hypothetical protein